jgi:hypothetical protein
MMIHGISVHPKKLIKREITMKMKAFIKSKRPSLFVVISMIAATLFVNSASASLLTSKDATLSSAATTSTVDVDGLNSSSQIPAGISSSIQVEEFDTSLGILQSIEVNFDTGYSSPYGIASNHYVAWPECINGSSGYCVYEHGFEANFDGFVGTSEGLSENIQTLSIGDTAQEEDFSGGSPGSSGSALVTSFLGSPAGPGLTFLPGSSPFTSYVGDGTGFWDLTFTFQLAGFSVFTNCEGFDDFSCTNDSSRGGEIIEGQLNWDISNIEVSYVFESFTPPNNVVSAPTSFALVGLGLTCIGWCRRKKRV